MQRDIYYYPLPGNPYRPFLAYPEKLSNVNPLWKGCTANSKFQVIDPPRVLHPQAGPVGPGVESLRPTPLIAPLPAVGELSTTAGDPGQSPAPAQFPHNDLPVATAFSHPSSRHKKPFQDDDPFDSLRGAIDPQEVHEVHSKPNFLKSAQQKGEKTDLKKLVGLQVKSAPDIRIDSKRDPVREPQKSPQRDTQSDLRGGSPHGPQPDPNDSPEQEKSGHTTDNDLGADGAHVGSPNNNPDVKVQSQAMPHQNVLDVSGTKPNSLSVNNPKLGMNPFHAVAEHSPGDFERPQRVFSQPHGHGLKADTHMEDSPGPNRPPPVDLPVISQAGNNDPITRIKSFGKHLGINSYQDTPLAAGSKPNKDADNTAGSDGDEVSPSNQRISADPPRVMGSPHRDEDPKGSFLPQKAESQDQSPTNDEPGGKAPDYSGDQKPDPQDPSPLLSMPSYEGDHKFTPPISYAGTIILPDSSSQYDFPGIGRLRPGDPSKTINGVTYSLAPSAASLLRNGVAVPIKAIPIPDFQPQPTPNLIFGGVHHQPDSYSNFIIGDMTLSAGGPAITVSGTRISLAADRQEAVIGSSTQLLIRLALGASNMDRGSNIGLFTQSFGNHEAPSGDNAILSFARSAYIPNAAGQYLVAGKTLAPGAAITVSNTRIALASDEAYAVVGSSTKTLDSLEKVEGPAIQFGGSTYYPDPSSAYLIASQTLTPGGAITVSGTPISLASDGEIAVIDKSTDTLLNAAPSYSPIIALGSCTYTADASGNFVIESDTLTRGGIVTVSGTPISYDKNGGSVVVGTSTEGFVGGETIRSKSGGISTGVRATGTSKANVAVGGFKQSKAILSGFYAFTPLIVLALMI